MNRLGKILFCSVAIILIILGIYRRINIYLSDIPLWWDEICLAESITNQSLFAVFKGLFGTQKCPILFVFITNIITKIFGINTFSFRFIPLIAGIGTFFTGFYVSKKLFQNKLTILLFLSFIAFCIPLVYYSSEFKPYSSDVFILLLLIFLYDKLDFNKISVKQSILYGLLALIICQFSFPAMFCITAIFITKMIENKKIYFKAIFPIFGVIFSGLYSMWLFRNIMDFEIHCEEVWQTGLLEFSFNSFNKMLTEFFEYININYNYGIWFLIAGTIIFIVQKNKYAICMFICFIIACIASLLHVYPLTGRIMLYMTPVFAFFILKPIDIEINNGNIKDNIINAVRMILLSVIICLSFQPGNILDKESYAINTFSFQYRKEEKQLYLNFLKEYKPYQKIFYNAKSSSYLNYYVNIEKDFKEIKLPDFINEIPESGEQYYNILSDAIKDKIDFLFVDINLNEEQLAEIKKICKDNNAKLDIYSSMDRLTIYKLNYD